GDYGGKQVLHELVADSVSLAFDFAKCDKCEKILDVCKNCGGALFELMGTITDTFVNALWDKLHNVGVTAAGSNSCQVTLGISSLSVQPSSTPVADVHLSADATAK